MKAGIGFHDITPEIGMRTELFQNLHIDKIVTPLLLKICIFEGEGLNAAVVTADVMDFFTDSCKDIRKIICDITLWENRLLLWPIPIVHFNIYRIGLLMKRRAEWKTTLTGVIRSREMVRFW